MRLFVCQRFRVFTRFYYVIGKVFRNRITSFDDMLTQTEFPKAAQQFELFMYSRILGFLQKTLPQSAYILRRYPIHHFVRNIST